MVLVFVRHTKSAHKHRSGIKVPHNVGNKMDSINFHFLSVTSSKVAPKEEWDKGTYMLHSKLCVHVVVYLHFNKSNLMVDMLNYTFES